MVVNFNISNRIFSTPLINNNYPKALRIINSMPNDTLNFRGSYHINEINVDFKTAKFVADSLSSSTAGHRALWRGDTLNPYIMELLAAAVGQYVIKNNNYEGSTPHVLIGGDTRLASRESLPLIRDVLIAQGVNVSYIKDPIPSPLLSVAAKATGADMTVLLTASHNPWSDGGFNLITSDGAIATPEITKEVSKEIIDIAKKGNYITGKTKKGDVFPMNPYPLYRYKIDLYGLIDWKKIRDAGISIYYDGLKGTGKNVFTRLLDEHQISYTNVESEGQKGPNPTKENLKTLRNSVICDTSDLKVGLSNDGDADRIGVIDENGDFISASDCIFLAVRHLFENKGLNGSIIRNQGTSSQIDIYAKNNGIDVIQTPIGFKYIGEEILNLRKSGSDILVAGEESGGFTINSHIPEKDGILALLLILDLMAEENKPLSQILKETKEKTNVEFKIHSFNAKLNCDSDKDVIMQRMENIYQDALLGKTEFGDFEIDVEKTKEVKEKMKE